MGHHGPAIHGLADKIQRVFPQKSPKGQVEDPKASASMISGTRVRTILVNGIPWHTIVHVHCPCQPREPHYTK